MNDDDDPRTGDFDALGDRLKRMAERLPVESREPAVPSVLTVSTLRSDRPRRRFIARAAGAAAVVGVVAVVTITVGDIRSSTIRDPAATSPPSDVTTIVSEPAPTASTDAAATVVATSTTAGPQPFVIDAPGPSNAAAIVGTIARPIIDLQGCAPGYARVISPNDDDVHLFTRWSSAPIVIQVVGDASGSIARPYAVVLRFFADQFTGPRRGDQVDINGAPATLTVQAVEGSVQWKGSVNWLLPDGSEAYIRARGFDRDQLIDLARSLQPRGSEAPVAGFDLTQPTPLGLAILDETNQPLHSGGITYSTCTHFSGAELRVVLVTGSIVYRFGVALDTGVLPAIEPLDDGTSIGVSGLPPFADQALLTVREATTDEWERLLTAPDTISHLTFSDIPIDDALTAVFTDQTFDDANAAAQAVQDFIRDHAPDNVDRDAAFATMIDYDHNAILLTLPVLDDPQLAETVWRVRLIGGTTIESIQTATRCQGGWLVADIDKCS